MSPKTRSVGLTDVELYQTLLTQREGKYTLPAALDLNPGDTLTITANAPRNTPIQAISLVTRVAPHPEHQNLVQVRVRLQSILYRSHPTNPRGNYHASTGAKKTN